MKSITALATVALLAAAGAPAQTVTNDWSASIQVVQTAAKVRLNNISITVLADGKIAVAVAWSWLDAGGKVIRSGVTRYTEAQITAKLAAKGSSVGQFKALFLAIAAEEASAP